MFGPSDSDIQGRRTHHRSATFAGLLSDLEQTFKGRFSVPDDWDILFLTGSGTLANEIVCSSFNTWVDGDVGRPFAQRLAQLAVRHRTGQFRRPKCLAFVGYDTASSTVGTCPEDVSHCHSTFADLVSAFPYYLPDRRVDLWSTVNCKQLGGSPVMSILAVGPNAQRVVWNDDVDSVLNLTSYLRYRQVGQTPHTPVVPLYVELLKMLEAFDLSAFRCSVDYRRRVLESVVPPDMMTGTGPVFTFRPSSLPEHVLKKWDVYPGCFGPQVFLYSGTDRDFNDFVDDIRSIPWPC